MVCVLSYIHIYIYVCTPVLWILNIHTYIHIYVFCDYRFLLVYLTIPSLLSRAYWAHPCTTDWFHIGSDTLHRGSTALPRIHWQVWRSRGCCDIFPGRMFALCPPLFESSLSRHGASVTHVRTWCSSAPRRSMKVRRMGPAVPHQDEAVRRQRDASHAICTRGGTPLCYPSVRITAPSVSFLCTRSGMPATFATSAKSRWELDSFAVIARLFAKSASTRLELRISFTRTVINTRALMKISRSTKASYRVPITSHFASEFLLQKVQEWTDLLNLPQFFSAAKPEREFLICCR